MAEDPVIAYRGGIRGRPATRPARGQKIDPTDPKVSRYATGAFGASAHGLVPAVATGATVADDPTDTFDTANPGTNQGVTVHTLSVPARADLAVRRADRWR